MGMNIRNSKKSDETKVFYYPQSKDEEFFGQKIFENKFFSCNYSKQNRKNLSEKL